MAVDKDLVVKSRGIFDIHVEAGLGKLTAYLVLNHLVVGSRLKFPLNDLLPVHDEGLAPFAHLWGRELVGHVELRVAHIVHGLHHIGLRLAVAKFLQKLPNHCLA